MVTPRKRVKRYSKYLEFLEIIGVGWMPIAYLRFDLQVTREQMNTLINQGRRDGIQFKTRCGRDHKTLVEIKLVSEFTVIQKLIKSRYGTLQQSMDRPD